MGSYVKKKIEYLVVDTSAFINKAALQELGENILTVPQVVEEIKSKRQLRRLAVLPFELSVKESFPENVKFVTEFSKKTGDYASLSGTDINVIALTYQLEKEKNGTDHLRSVPVSRPTIHTTTAIPKDLKKIPGFYVPKKVIRARTQSEQSDEASQYNSAEDEHYDSAEDGDFDTLTSEHISVTDETQPDIICENGNSRNLPEEITESESVAKEIIRNVKENKDESVSEKRNENENIVEKTNTEEHEDDFDKECNEEESDENDDDYENVDIKENNDVDNDNVDDGGGGDDGDDDDEDENEDENEDDELHWITPSNIDKTKNQIASELQENFENVNVACLTTDFAMQNVLKQIGLHVISIDGKLIKQLRTFILRCYGCFKTTSIMTKVFCPNCGNKTLKKVAVSLDENGLQKVHINFHRPLTARGKKYSLPRFKGGKHSNNPVVCEDQPMPQQRPSRLSRTKNNPLNDDYIAGYSPFVTRDVTSKSAMLGIKPHIEMKHRMRKNPNEARRKKK